MSSSPSKRVPDFVIELGDYMLGIKNLSKSYVVNMTETLAQFLDFVNVHKLKKRYKKIKDMDLNVVRSLTNFGTFAPTSNCAKL